MGKERTLILDKERIDRKLQRMAFQLWESCSTEKTVTFVGIEGSGAVVAKSLAKRLQKISPLQVELIMLKLNKRNPLSKDISIGGK